MYQDKNCVEVIQSSGVVRAAQENTPDGTIPGSPEYPVSRVKFGAVEGMPDPQPDTVYVVSQITAAALKEQGRTDDILIVDRTVRDSEGKIIGCEGFARV